MSIDQALLEMELVGHDFYLFRDDACGHPSVVYRRHGYQYGLGYEFRPDHVWSFDGEVWFVQRDDRVVFTNDVQATGDEKYGEQSAAREGDDRNHNRQLEASHDQVRGRSGFGIRRRREDGRRWMQRS